MKKKHNNETNSNKTVNLLQPFIKLHKCDVISDTSTTKEAVDVCHLTTQQQTTSVGISRRRKSLSTEEILMYVLEDNYSMENPSEVEFMEMGREDDAVSAFHPQTAKEESLPGTQIKKKTDEPSTLEVESMEVEYAISDFHPQTAEETDERMDEFIEDEIVPQDEYAILPQTTEESVNVCGIEVELSSEGILEEVEIVPCTQIENVKDGQSVVVSNSNINIYNILFFTLYSQFSE